jgi:hypothetical protein
VGNQAFGLLHALNGGVAQNLQIVGNAFKVVFQFVDLLKKPVSSKCSRKTCETVPRSLGSSPDIAPPKK